MQFQIKRDTLLKSLSVAHNIIERKNTIPILANVLLEIKGNILNIIATDLDIVFHDQISDLKIGLKTQVSWSTGDCRALDRLI